MSIILAIETATEACSAALLFHDQIISRFQLASNQHTKLILPMCDELLREANITFAQLDAIAFGSGPGSFTGVRIAASIAQGFAAAHDLPVLPISSLLALAQEAYIQYQASHVLAGIDARRGEVYWGAFANNGDVMQPLMPEVLGAPKELTAPAINEQWMGAGSAWKSYGEELRAPFQRQLKQIDELLYPTAHAVLLLAQHDWALGKAVSVEKALPNYLRNKVVD